MPTEGYYLTLAPPSDVRALCSSLVDHSIHLISTKAGSRVVAECAAYGTTKDRKRIMKSLTFVIEEYSSQ